MNFSIRQRNTRAAALCLTVVLATAAGALAYVLPAPQILDLMVENLGSARALEISQKNIWLGSTVQSSACGGNSLDCTEPPVGMQQSVEDMTTSPPVTVQETVRYAFPQSFRSDTSAPPTERTHIYSLGRSATVIDGTVSGGPESPFDYYIHLLLHRSRNELALRLAERGVNLEVTSLGRFDGRMAFILGAIYPDNSLPQVWIDKQTMRPFRWIVQGAKPGEESTQFEIRYGDWRRIDRTWYPHQIEFTRNETPVRLIQVENIIADPELNREIFSIDQLLARSQPAPAQSGSGTSKSGESDIQKTIEEFKRLFE